MGWRDEQHGRIDAFASQTFRQFDSTDGSRIYGCDDEIDILEFRGSDAKSIRGTVHFDDEMTVGAKAAADQPEHHRIILNDQYPGFLLNVQGVHDDWIFQEISLRDGAQ